jgi:hypothetical protein
MDKHFAAGFQMGVSLAFHIIVATVSLPLMMAISEWREGSQRLGLRPTARGIVTKLSHRRKSQQPGGLNAYCTNS